MGLSWEDWRCLGYRVEADGKVVVVSGDAVDCDGLERLAKGADVLVHCCYLAEEEITDHDSELIAKYILASPSQVGRIAERAGARKLVLTHIKEKPKEMLRRVMEDIQRYYGGRVVVGNDLMAIDV
jgi:ribonuclease Z